jgi:cysteine desulfurase
MGRVGFLSRVSQRENGGLNGHPERRLPNTLNVSLPGIQAGDLLGSLKDVAASAGAACAAGKAEPSHVLRAMGLSDEEALSSVRLSLGRFTSRQEVAAAAKDLLRSATTLVASADPAQRAGGKEATGERTLPHRR